MIYYEQGFCLTKFGAPFFASPSKTASIQKVLVQPFLFYSTKCLGGSDWMRSLVPLLKLFAVKNSFEKKLLLLSLAGQLFFWTKFFGWRKYFQTRFSGFPDQPDPENRMLPSWANPWAKRSSTAPQA